MEERHLTHPKYVLDETMASDWSRGVIDQAAIEKMVRPPMLADIGLKNQPSSILPGRRTYIDVSVVKSYQSPPLTWREHLHAIWIDRICGAWRVLIGTAYVEYKDYD